MTRSRWLIGLCVLAAAVAWAKANIVIDGQNADWSSTTTCEPSLGNGSCGIKLSRVCEDNKNDGGSSGRFFTLVESDSGFPTIGDRYFGVGPHQQPERHHGRLHPQLVVRR